MSKHFDTWPGACFFNYRTDKFDFDGFNGRDAIPQDPALLKLFDFMRQIGKSDEDAADAAYDAYLLKMRTFQK